MIRNICTDRFFLMQPSEPATAADLPVAQDLRDTLAAHRQACVGMAANMIGVRRRIIIFDDNGTPTVMLNPVSTSAINPSPRQSIRGQKKRTVKEDTFLFDKAVHLQKFLGVCQILADDGG